jgi:hypothetical protein
MGSILPKFPRVVYRKGTRSSDNLTPRPGKDTIGRPGQAPGLSTFETLELKTGERAQMIDLGQLSAPLRGIPDDTQVGGIEGHVSLVPIDTAGNIDQHGLQDWAASRGTSSIHLFTQMVRSAIIREVRG